MLFSRLWIQNLVFWSGAVLVTVAAILAAKASVLANGFFTNILHGRPFLAFVVTPLGFGAAIWLTRHVFRGTEGSGIPQTIAALQIPAIAERRTVLSLKIAAGKILLTTLGLCVGASVGREGPAVQIGASIMHRLGKWVPFRVQDRERALILAGGAAGIAAAFNTPLAGVLFAIEELSRAFEEKTSGVVLTTVIIAGIVSMSLLGNYTYFGHTSVTLELWPAIKTAVLCGVIGGLAGGTFARLLIWFSNDMKGLMAFFIHKRPVVFALLCGLALACIGYLSDGSIYGTGYDQAKSLMEQSAPLPQSFGLLKLLATFVSYISGMPGGLFAPCLAAGAGLGANIAPFLPDVPTSAVIILGMIGTFTGVVQVPITAAIIVMEMTDDQSLTLPLMATALIALGVSRLVCPKPLYQTLALGFLEKSTRRDDR